VLELIGWCQGVRTAADRLFSSPLCYAVFMYVCTYVLYNEQTLINRTDARHSRRLTCEPLVAQVKLTILQAAVYSQPNSIPSEPSSIPRPSIIMTMNLRSTSSQYADPKREIYCNWPVPADAPVCYGRLLSSDLAAFQSFQSTAECGVETKLGRASIHSTEGYRTRTRASDLVRASFDICGCRSRRG
jgi:hypothetical protein